MSPQRTGLLVTAHGSPDTLDELPAFLQNIRRGRPAPPDVLAEVRRRYDAIGGRSPLPEITRAQADALARRVGLPAFIGMRLWTPTIADALNAMRADGIERVVSVPIAPYSVHVYNAAVIDAARAIDPSLAVSAIEPWNVAPAFVDAWLEVIADAWSARTSGVRTRLILSAHSLPVRAIEAGDPYAKLVEQTFHAITSKLPDGSCDPRLVYQSQGMTGDTWLGPDLPSAFRAARDEGFGAVIVAPIGFLTDHVEILYDLDIEAAAIARSLGLGFARTRALNVHPKLVEALAAAVSHAAA